MSSDESCIDIHVHRLHYQIKEPIDTLSFLNDIAQDHPVESTQTRGVILCFYFKENTGSKDQKSTSDKVIAVFSYFCSSPGLHYQSGFSVETKTTATMTLSFPTAAEPSFSSNRRMRRRNISKTDLLLWKSASSTWHHCLSGQ